MDNTLNGQLISMIWWALAMVIGFIVGFACGKIEKIISAIKEEKEKKAKVRSFAKCSECLYFEPLGQACGQCKYEIAGHDIPHGPPGNSMYRDCPYFRQEVRDPEKYKKELDGLDLILTSLEDDKVNSKRGGRHDG